MLDAVDHHRPVDTDHIDDALDPQQVGTFEQHDQIEPLFDRIEALPGVVSVGAVDALPLAHGSGCYAIFIQGVTAEGDQLIVPVAVGRRVEGGVYVLDGTLWDDIDGGATPVLDMTAIANLPGVHNWQNAAAAYAVARAIDVEAPVAAACLQSFPGLAHRMELVAIVDGVRYVNDSKATNAAAADKALACYEDVYWIAGGRPKAGGIADLAARFANIAHAFLIGEATEALGAALGGRLATTRCLSIEDAVESAASIAEPGEVVLLAPACASFDQFASFEERGERFAVAAQRWVASRGPGR